MKYFVGCSGYMYKDWRGKFYPEDLPQKDWLPYYASKFNTVEINYTFYRLPQGQTFLSWYKKTPGEFCFTLKGSRYITHFKKLKDVKEAVAGFYERAALLKEKLGCILWQLPGNLRVDLGKLERFCETISDEFNNVLEFRHPSWFGKDVMQVLQEHNVTCCILSSPGCLPFDYVTSDIAYVRFHGEENWYDYNYSKTELQAWKKRIAGLPADRAYIYFNNDVNARAVENSYTLRELLLNH